MTDVRQAPADGASGPGTDTGRPDQSAPFRRPVSPTEWLYLAGARLARPFAIQIVVEGTGTIPADVLRRAVAEASAACPGARLALRGRTWADTGRAPAVRTAGDYDSATREPLAPAEGRGCEVVLLGGGGETTTLVFRVHHAVMDAMGALAWTADVFRALRGEALVGAPSPLYDLALLGTLGDGARREPVTPRWRSPLPGVRRGHATRWHRRTLPGAHPGIVAKTAAALARLSPGATRVMVPVDLRRHRPELRSTANLSLPVFLDGRADDPWEQWHERLLRALAGNRELAAGEEEMAVRLPLGALAGVLTASHAASVATGRYSCSSLVTALGRVGTHEMCAPGFEADSVYSLPVQAPFVPLSFTAVEFGGRTELAMSHPGGPRADARAAALLDSVCESLASGAASARHVPAVAGPRRSVPPLTLTALLRRQVDRAPGAVALTGPEGPVTYGELDRRSDVVAAELRARGVGRGSVVGLLADRSVAAVAGLWGVLKAGAAYLPLDPAHPTARIASVLDDAGASCCLTGRAQRTLPGPDCPTLVLDDLPASGAEPVPDTTRPDDVAYVIYTSGSTGRPKGVVVEHRALVNYTRWATDRYRVDASTRFALFTSLAFDLTGTTLFLPPAAGGSIALVPDEPDHRVLREMLTGSGVNALKLTPAHLDLIGSLDIEPRSFRTLVVGGEQLRGTVAARAQRMFGPDCLIVNEYGPTEAAIGCVVHAFDPDRDGGRPAVPIGLPADNTEAFLLDPDGGCTEPGGTGEIHLAGAQLARGYLGRPDLDRERFVRLADGTRAYRTGDLAQLTSDGVLRYLGRADEQLSIRGHRIEPGEVEAALETHPDVSRAVAVAVPPRDGAGPVLCAYVTGAAEPDAVRAHASRRLPAYMVPVAVRVVDAFPWTVNGKVDVRALPDPFGEAGATGAAGADSATAGDARSVGPPPGHEPHDVVEEAVAGIWARILGDPGLRAGPGDDFHRLGGDSLTLLRMLAAVAAEVVGTAGESAFDARLRDLIASPTLGNVCAAVRRSRPDRSDRSDRSDRPDRSDRHTENP
ncbi:non-ribosomal peptide synthetase [Streptomyces sp. HNM0575]|uniref:non-ribosomal peptide synthetase n=1 Tax=Streptomyces sp. HNM0575 TaxID=2716338 RepID=UPI00145E321C|nr:non-ribosomal peptide synthetase [Streptomyces sp. HNM0575]NLU76228.1 non-ribosomal peptide synthetase [Streptomyces sp. HNM0575]